MDELESRRYQVVDENTETLVSGNETEGNTSNQLVAEDYMSREEMDDWWKAAKEAKVEGCPTQRFDLVWTIS